MLLTSHAFAEQPQIFAQVQVRPQLGPVLVAEGAVDVMVEPILALWDVAAIRPIVEEAGGRVSDLTGDGWADEAPCVTTNGALHDVVLAALTSGS